MTSMLNKGLLLLLMCAAFSCGGTKKLAFNSAYKFSSYNYHKSGSVSVGAAVLFILDQL